MLVIDITFNSLLTREMLLQSNKQSILGNVDLTLSLFSFFYLFSTTIRKIKVLTLFSPLMYKL